MAHDWRPDDEKLTRLERGTFITTRTEQSIASDRRDGRVFSGVVNEDVWDDYRRLAMPAIPSGTRVEVIVRTARDGDLILDLESLRTVTGTRSTQRRSALRAKAGSLETRYGRTHERRRVAGDRGRRHRGRWKGAAIGAATGLGLALHGRSVRAPAGSRLAFRLERPLVIGISDDAFTRDGRHDHHYTDD